MFTNETEQVPWGHYHYGFTITVSNMMIAASSGICFGVEPPRFSADLGQNSCILNAISVILEGQFTEAFLVVGCLLVTLFLLFRIG
jgi:hypothetical protein